jgi:hypothetical protein
LSFRGASEAREPGIQPPDILVMSGFRIAAISTLARADGSVRNDEGLLKRDSFKSNRYRALRYYSSMIFSENRFPLFGIML